MPFNEDGRTTHIVEPPSSTVMNSRGVECSPSSLTFAQIAPKVYDYPPIINYRLDSNLRFPIKLHHAASDERVSFIQWSLHGDCIFVHSTEFENHVMRYCPGLVRVKDFKNLKRQFRVYGFEINPCKRVVLSESEEQLLLWLKRIWPECRIHSNYDCTCVYKASHSLFVKSKPELTSNMRTMNSTRNKVSLETVLQNICNRRYENVMKDSLTDDNCSEMKQTGTTASQNEPPGPAVSVENPPARIYESISPPRSDVSPLLSHSSSCYSSVRYTHKTTTEVNAMCSRFSSPQEVTEQEYTALKNWNKVPVHMPNSRACTSSTVQNPSGGNYAAMKVKDMHAYCAESQLETNNYFELCPVPTSHSVDIFSRMIQSQNALQCRNGVYGNDLQWLQGAQNANNFVSGNLGYNAVAQASTAVTGCLETDENAVCTEDVNFPYCNYLPYNTRYDLSHFTPLSCSTPVKNSGYDVNNNHE